MSDLCWVCQQNSVAIMRSANTPETGNKLHLQKQMVLDLLWSIDRFWKMLRHTYNRQLRSPTTGSWLTLLSRFWRTPSLSTASLKYHPLVHVYHLQVKTSPYTLVLTWHTYVNIHIMCMPSSQQLYIIWITRCTISVTPSSLVPCIFLTPRKCAIFGYVVRPYQDRWDLFRNFQCTTIIVFLLDRWIILLMRLLNVAKGQTVWSACCITSCTHNLGEATLCLHADNCSSQNKNCYVMQYLTWRILTGLNKKITLSFLIVGHTKFSRTGVSGCLNKLSVAPKLDVSTI